VENLATVLRRLAGNQGEETKTLGRIRALLTYLDILEENLSSFIS
jgi:hypothetical protein